VSSQFLHFGFGIFSSNDLLLRFLGHFDLHSFDGPSITIVPLSNLTKSLVHRSDAESIIQLLGAVGVLVIPASFGAWIFSTIRALHLRQLRFWQMRSTYVSLIFGVLALGLVLLNAAILLFSKDHSSFQADTTLYPSRAALVAVIATLWCAWSNWRVTKSVSLCCKSDG